MDISKQKKDNTSKELDEQLFRSTFEEAAVGIAHVNPEGKFIRLNKRFCDITGYSAPEMMQKTFQEITHPEDLGEDQDLVRQLLEDEISSYNLEKRYFRKEGNIVWVSLTVTLVRTRNGFPDYFISCVQDISERKQSEKALMDQEDSYKSLIEQAKDGIVLIQDEKVVYTNKALSELIGYAKSEMKYLSFFEFLAEDERDRVRQIYEARMKNKSAPSIYESALTHKDGQRLEVEINAGLSTLNGLPTDIVILRDISLRKKEQEKLEESESRFRALYDHAGFALGMAKGGSSKHELVNQAWVDMFGYDDVSEVLGKSALDFVAPGDRDLVRKYAKLRSEGKEAPSSYEIKGLRKDGTTFDMEMRVSIYTYEDELHSIAMITDITDRKKTQAERDRFFNLSSDLISISGFDGYFKHLNPAWEDVTGFKINELLAQAFSSFLHPDDREKTAEEVKKLSQGIPTIHFENRYITKEGKIRYLSWRATPLVENQLIYSIARDVTESREAEDQIRNYQQRLKALSTELTLSEEKQRRQIAADLHDHVGQLMASSRLQLAAIHEDMEKKMILSRVKDVSKGLIAAIQATRNAIFDLSPPQLNEIGLFAAIADWMEEQVEIKHGIKAHISGDDEHYPLNEDIRVLIFRCVRELLMNVVKHSGADEVRVEMNLVEDCLNISVRDNGKGFLYNPHMLQLKSAGFGLFSIQERYSDMGGTVEIDTAPGEGTTVFLSLALNDTKE